MKINLTITALLIFILAVSICTGAFFETGMSQESKDGLSAALQSSMTSDENPADTSYAQTLFYSLKKYIPALAAAFIAPAVFVTLPLLPLLIIWEGLSAGFTAAMLFETMGIKALPLILALLPHNLINMPVCCLLASVSIQASLVNFRGHLFRNDPHMRRNKKALHQSARPYIIMFAAGTAVIVISCILEAFLLQPKLLPS